MIEDQPATICFEVKPAIETLSYERFISDEIRLLAINDKLVQDHIFNDIKDNIIEQVKKYVVISGENDMFKCGMRIRGTLKIVK
ncbi:MAG: hypothetical protein BWX78_01381 [Firmicutes bacterium ADurb.Bin099]|nr:MAG: hypothetical protein BWX78_01381 [Firmicutes bacterium ADurb.Bin099]